MSRINNNDNQLNDSLKLARKSKSLIPQIKNWCANIKIDSDYGGMIGQMGLPTMNTISCTQYRGGSTMNLEWIAKDFITENCPNCRFHNEVNKNNYGRNIILENEERKKKVEKEKIEELKIIKQLEEKLVGVLKKRAQVKTPEASILKLLLSIKDNSSNKKQKATEIFEASKLSPEFFNSLSLDYLSIYLKDEEISELLISTCQNIITYDDKVISKYFLEKIISLVNNEIRVNIYLKILPFNLLKKEQVFEIANELIEKYDIDSFDYNHFENHSKAIITFFSNFYELYNIEFFTLLENSLKDSNSNFRANATLILYQLYSINNNIVIPLINNLIKSLDLQDVDFPKSADYITSKTLLKVSKLQAKEVFNIIKKEFTNLTIGGKIELFRFYDLYVNDSIKNSKNIHTKFIVNQLINICLDKKQPRLKEQAIKTFENFSRNNPDVLLKDFDNFIGVLSNSVIAKTTFEWYKKDLDKNTLTFNPLKGKGFDEIILEENQLDSEILKLKGILKKLLKHNQVLLYEKLIEIIRNIEGVDKNSTQLKLFFIEIIRDGVKDPIVLTNILPDLHTWLLDFKNVPLRIQAFRFLESLLSNNFQIVPQTIFSLLEIFIEDNNDILIKKYAIQCYKQILINGRPLKEKEVTILLNLFKSKYIIIHKTATVLTYRLFDLLDNKDRLTLLTYLISLLECYHNETNRDDEFCLKLFNLAMFVSKEVNPNHFEITEKKLIEKYLVDYCKSNDYYFCLNSLKVLTTFKDSNSYYNDMWLEQSLSFIYKIQPNRFEKFITSDRGKLYENILSLNLNNVIPFKESIKENIKKRCLYNIELYTAELHFTIIIFLYFNLIEDVLELTSFIENKIPRTQALKYLFNGIDEFSRLSNILIINESNLTPNEVKLLIEKQEVSENEIVSIQEFLAKKQFYLFNDFTIKKTNTILSEKTTLLTEYEKLIKNTSNSKEEDLFYGLKLLSNAILFFLEWSKEVIEGGKESINKLSASKTNIKLINIESYNHIPLLKEQIKKIGDKIEDVTVFNSEKIVEIINIYAQLKIPFIYYVKKNENQYHNQNILEEKVEKNEVYVVSLELYLKDNPWANPQILKSKEIYMIKGKLKLNQIPTGFDLLKIQPSTTNSDIFELNIEEIELKNNKFEYEITGNILFKYAQNSLEDLISIKLIPFFSNKGNKLCPAIIGYDELITKVIDERNDFFQTGFKMMNKKVFELYNNSLIQQLDDEEKSNFFTILNGIINYQGYCLQSGRFKGVKSCKEESFRDELIQHLTANPSIGENISKEAQIAGGRVEITYKGIAVELKVETKLTERDMIIEKYGNQPLAYSSGNSKLASIICVLDLTDKKSPPSPATNNIIISTKKTHGFQNNSSEFNPFQAFIFIDGNTKNPSDYSK